mmetsp:Transcript_25195/g.54030  ORF Transcript_25195/g.54030 Transcript_25195/m.54030 type:complete len:286 (+) Transcript_25195:45-902(+)
MKRHRGSTSSSSKEEEEPTPVVTGGLGPSSLQVQLNQTQSLPMQHHQPLQHLPPMRRRNSYNSISCLSGQPTQQQQHMAGMPHSQATAAAAAAGIPIPVGHGRGMYYEPRHQQAYHPQSWPDEAAPTLHHVGSSHSIDYVPSPPFQASVLGDPCMAPAVMQAHPPSPAPHPASYPAESNISNVDSRATNPNSDTVTVKATYMGSTMRFRIRPDMDLGAVASQIEKHFSLVGKGAVLQYLDEDNEMISLKNNDDLWEALTTVRESPLEKKIIRIKVELLNSQAARE